MLNEKLQDTNELTDSEITKKIAEIKVIKSLKNKSLDEKLIRLSDPLGDKGPIFYDPFSYDQNCKERDDFEVHVHYFPEKEAPNSGYVCMRVYNKNGNVTGINTKSFKTKKEICKAVLLCIIENEGDKK